jgi:HEAT repeat protein
VEPHETEDDFPPEPVRKGSSPIKILLIVFGSIATVFVLICAGVISLGYWATKASREKFEEIKSNIEANVPAPAVDVSVKPPADFNEALAYLKDANVSKRNAAAVWLARKPRDPAREADIARLLVPLLSDPNTQVRLAGVKALDTWATREQTTALLDVLNDEDAPAGERRQIAIHTLGRLKDNRAVEPLAHRLTHFFDREHAAQALREMGPMAEAAVLKYFHNPDNAARESARRIIQGFHTKDEAILAQSIQDLKGPDFEYRKTVAQWLCQTPVQEERRKEVDGALEPLLSDSRPEVRLAGLKALAVWGTPANVPALIRAVDDDSNDVRQLAMQTLIRLKDPRGAQAIAGRLTNFFDRDLATRALQDMGPSAEKVVVKYYHHQDNEVRDRARRLLQDYHTKPSVIFEQTAEDLKSPEKTLRVNCAEWLAQQQPADADRRAVAVALESLLTESDRGVGVAGMKAMRKWATKDNVPALLNVLKDEEFSPQAGEMRKLAMHTLADLKDERGVPVVAAKLLNFFEREEAARALIAMGPMAEKTVLTGLTNQDAAVRKLVCAILAEIGTKTSLTALKRTGRGDPDRNVAATALLAVGAINARITAAEKQEKETKPTSTKDIKPDKPADKNSQPKNP